MDPHPSSITDSILGCLLGTGVGDALGLPAEGLRREQMKTGWKSLRHRFFFGRGMFSDDTEHTLMVTECLLKHPQDVAAFRRSLGWKLRWWMAALPAGVGLATARAVMKLWLGWPASRSGVNSAGNGAAMRSAIIGVVFRDDPAQRRVFAEASARITHTDPRALESALMVAEAAAMASHRIPTAEVLIHLQSLIATLEMRERMDHLMQALGEGATVAEFADRIGCATGISGFAPNTVAAAFYAWLRHRDSFEDAVSSVIGCGGDTDTAGAITGALCGAEQGEGPIPRNWLQHLVDWPRSVNYVRKLSVALSTPSAPRPSLCWPLIPLRNLLFLLVVLVHGFRRLLPF